MGPPTYLQVKRGYELRICTFLTNQKQWIRKSYYYSMFFFHKYFLVTLMQIGSAVTSYNNETGLRTTFHNRRSNQLAKYLPN